MKKANICLHIFYEKGKFSLLFCFWGSERGAGAAGNVRRARRGRVGVRLTAHVGRDVLETSGAGMGCGGYTHFKAELCQRGGLGAATLPKEEPTGRIRCGAGCGRGRAVRHRAQDFVFSGAAVRGVSARMAWVAKALRRRMMHPPLIAVTAGEAQ